MVTVINYNGIVEIRKLLRKSGYTVNVTHTPSGCYADYPSRIIPTTINPSRTNYVQLPNAIQLCHHIDDQKTEDYWYVPNYSRRICILCDVIKKCREYDYNIGLIRFVKDNKRLHNIFDVVDLNLSPIENEQESLLLFLVSETKFGTELDNFTEIRQTAVSSGIVEGFDFLTSKLLSK